MGTAHRLRRAVGALQLDVLVQPQVTALNPVDLAAGMALNNHLGYHQISEPPRSDARIAWQRHTVQAHSAYQRRTFFTVGHWATASSTTFLSGMALPPRIPSSAVMTTSTAALLMRSRRASEEKPAKTTLR